MQATMKRHNIFLAVIIGLIIVAAIVLILLGKRANAINMSNVSGFAWSSNIGWISFNSADNGSGGGDYRVRVDALGNISGFAWSSNIGWVSFNSADVADCPGTMGNATCAPKLNIATGEVTGWARACAGTNDGHCVGNSRLDGWDGWISLHGTGPNYGVVADGTSPRNWSGFAWGSNVVGWISFRGSGFGVFDSAEPTPLIATCSADPNPQGLNRIVNWSGLVGGGTAPYVYSWSGTNGLAGSGLTVAKSYAAEGVKNAALHVLDSGNPAQSAIANCSVSIVHFREINASNVKIKEIIPE